MTEVIKDIIRTASTDELADSIITTFINIEKEFINKKWKYSELESGHFVEAIRRFLEYKLFSQYTPFSESIASFNNTILSRYEQASGLEEYRIIIPRVLYSIYCIRNKRGVGHISAISPNHQDAIHILMSCKWILAEIIRIESAIDPDETLNLINKVTQRQLDVIWEQGDVKRILIDDLNLKEKILIHLYENEKLLFEELDSYIEYKNKSYLKKVIKELHQSRLLEYNEQQKDCVISPKGEIEVERIIINKIEENSL